MQAERLRAQAERYRHIARAVSRADVVETLLDYAAECESRAQRLDEQRRRASHRAVRRLIAQVTSGAALSVH